MAEAKKAKAPKIKKTTKVAAKSATKSTAKGTTSRLGSSKVRGVEKRNMVALNESVMEHMKLKVGDVVSYTANEDGTVTVKKAAKPKRKILSR